MNTPTRVPTIHSTELTRSPGLPEDTDLLFTSQDDWWNNACVNWQRDGWGAYARGYKEAADILAKQVMEQNALADLVVYPILFLYRQYLELQIKDLIRVSYRLLDRHEDLPLHHRLKDLWATCHPLMVEIAPHDSTEELRQIGRLLGEFSTVDPLSMSFRYPEDKHGNPSLTPTLRHINIRNVAEVVGKISVILFGAGVMFDEYLGYKAEMEVGY